MDTITVPRTDVTTEEVVTALRDGLGDRYNVLPGMAIGQLAYQRPHEGQRNAIVVGTGGNRLVKAQVTIVSRAGQTELRITPGGVTLDLVFNSLGVASKVRRVLANSPSLTVS